VSKSYFFKIKIYNYIKFFGSLYPIIYVLDLEGYMLVATLDHDLCINCMFTILGDKGSNKFFLLLQTCFSLQIDGFLGLFNDGQVRLQSNP
jgi:hypothetical protein